MADDLPDDFVRHVATLCKVTCEDLLWGEELQRWTRQYRETATNGFFVSAKTLEELYRTRCKASFDMSKDSLPSLERVIGEVLPVVMEEVIREFEQKIDDVVVEVQGGRGRVAALPSPVEMAAESSQKNKAPMANMLSMSPMPREGPNSNGAKSNAKPSRSDDAILLDRSVTLTPSTAGPNKTQVNGLASSNTPSTVKRPYLTQTAGESSKKRAKTTKKVCIAISPTFERETDHSLHT